MPNQNNSSDIISKAIEKIKKETKEFKGDSKEKVIHTYVSNTLIGFCEQSEKFAEVLLKTKRTLSDCCKYCLEGVTTSISDIDTYRRAVQFYFPNSEISMNMTIEIGDAPDDEYINKISEIKTENKKNKVKKVQTIKKSDNNIKAPDKEKVKKTVNNSKKKEKKDDGVIQLSLF